MLILTYFHQIIGPDILMTEPENLPHLMKESVLNEIKNYIDIADEGF